MFSQGLVEQPNVTWVKMDDVSMGDLNELNITTITVIDESVTNVTVILDPVLFEHRGVYICIADYNISLTYDTDSDSQEYELIVDCTLSLLLTSLPPPLLHFSVSLNNIIVICYVFDREKICFLQLNHSIVIDKKTREN